MSRSSVGQYIGYVSARAFIALFALVPFPLLYAKAKFLKFILFRVVGYRKRVVRENLHASFPEKSETETAKIENDFYDNLSMILLESFKGFHMTEKQFGERYKLVNSGGAEKYLSKGQDIILLAGHVANWEWFNGLFVPPFAYKALVLYKPLKNKFLDKYLNRSRAKFNSKMLSIYNTKAFFMNREKGPWVYILAADQSPSNRKKSYVADFFHRRTYFLHGPEKYARFLKTPVYYFHIQRVKKGFYESEFELVCEDAAQLPKGEIIKRYAALLEEDIRKKPADWLWSHRRWKHKVPEDYVPPHQNS